MDEMIQEVVEQNENEAFWYDVINTVAEDKTRTVTKNWFGRKIEIRKTIGFGAVQDFIGHVVAECFDDDGEYVASMRDFMTRYCTVMYYTNVPLPTDVDEAGTFLYDTNLYDLVKSVADPTQLAMIVDAVNSQLKYRLDMKLDVAQAAMIRMRDSMTELTKLFESLSEDDMQKIVSSLNGGNADNVTPITAAKT